MLPRLLGQVAARSGQVLNMAAISGAIGLGKSTTENARCANQLWPARRYL
jgi:hypothetical protein